MVYDTMWHSTEMMAEAISAGIAEEGVDVKPMYLRKCHRSDIMTEVMDARRRRGGFSDAQQRLFPTVADILTYMKGLKPVERSAPLSVPTAGAGKRSS